MWPCGLTGAVRTPSLARKLSHVTASPLSISIFERHRLFFFSTRSTMMKLRGTPSASAIESLKAMQCKIFGNTYNPTNARTGAKYLRQALRGPAMVKYYPPVLSLKALNRANPDMGRLQDSNEVKRLANVAYKKSIGKGPPKKGMLQQPEHRMGISLSRLLTISFSTIRRGTKSRSQRQEKVKTCITHHHFVLLYTSMYANIAARFFPIGCELDLALSCMIKQCAQLRTKKYKRHMPQE